MREASGLVVVARLGVGVSHAIVPCPVLDPRRTCERFPRLIEYLRASCARASGSIMRAPIGDLQVPRSIMRAPLGDLQVLRTIVRVPVGDLHAHRTIVRADIEDLRVSSLARPSMSSARTGSELVGVSANRVGSRPCFNHASTSLVGARRLLDSASTSRDPCAPPRRACTTLARRRIADSCKRRYAAPLGLETTRPAEVGPIRCGETLNRNRTLRLVCLPDDLPRCCSRRPSRRALALPCPQARASRKGERAGRRPCSRLPPSRCAVNA